MKLSSSSTRALTKIDNRATLLGMSGDGEKGETRFQGVGVSPGMAPKTMPLPGEAHILVAHNLTPSDTPAMDRHRVLGSAIDLGSRTSHTAIMARSLGIPAVVGLHDVTEKLESGCVALLDGFTGKVIIN